VRAPVRPVQPEYVVPDRPLAGNLPLGDDLLRKAFLFDTFEQIREVGRRAEMNEHASIITEVIAHSPDEPRQH
jgi:hypothetical protein